MFPTTTIGSFPQTEEIRQMRQKYKKGEISKEDYKNFVKQKDKRGYRNSRGNRFRCFSTWRI